MYVIVGNEGNWDIDILGVVKMTYGVRTFLDYVEEMVEEEVKFVVFNQDLFDELLDRNEMSFLCEGDVVGWVETPRPEGEGEGNWVHVLVKLEDV